MAPRQPEALVRRLQTMVMIRTLLFLCALFPLLMLSLAACSNDSSDGSVSTTQTPPSSNPPAPQPPPPPPPPPGSPSIVVTSGTTFVSSPVRISFSVADFAIGLPGSPHMTLSIDGGPLNDFYNGSGITSDNGVLLNGFHNHAVHWTSTNSFDRFGLAAGPHSVRLALVDSAEVASTTHNFTVQQPPSGDLQLQSVLSGLNFPVGLSLAPDGRIFY